MMKLLRVLFVFINLFFLQFKIILSVDDIIPYIYKGKEAKLEDFPSIVQLRSLGIWYCAGTLISPKHVLTAAHCVHKVHTVVSGSLSSLAISGKNVQNIPVSYSCVHPKYFIRINSAIKSEKVFHDIAILELESPMKIGDTCQTIEMATKRSRPGTKCNMTGWAAHRDIEFIHTLRYKEFSVGFAVECFKWLFFVPFLHICGVDRSGTRASAIYGDSGGPFYCKGKLEGVISSGKVSRATVLTSVPYHRKWIENFMKTGDRKKYCAIATRYNLSTCVKIFTVAIIVIQYYGIFN